MAISDVSSKTFINELMRLSLSLIWKNAYMANIGEDPDLRIDAETYIASRNKDLRFNSVFQFHEEVLAQFFPNTDELAIVLANKRMIPEEMRDAIVAAESKFMIDLWENRDGETNDYYRMLFGLPPMGTPVTEYVYNTRYGEIDMKTPIHLLPYTDRLRLEKLGYIDELLKEPINATKEYLKYIGKHRIYPYVARQADEYQLLYIEPSSYAYLRSDFIEMYEQARLMVVRVYYTDAYRNKSHLYEKFLGLCVLFITQQRMYSKYLEADISRNFYDIQSLKLVYTAYGMPFYPSIPLKYHERIVKHMNELIGYKGSTQVFYDLFDIFNFAQMEVYEYYLVKDRKTDAKGNPLFRDAEGHPLDPKDMYHIRFAKVPWKSDKFVEITKPDNSVPYDRITVPDPYWIEDPNLVKKLYEEDWNFFQSKYMGTQIMFDLSKLLFESCYFLRMLQDNRSPLSKLVTYYMVTGEDVPIFDMVIYAIALLCKNIGYTGEIPSDPSAIAHVYGFNFKEYATLLKMGTETMTNFILYFKKACHEYALENVILKTDDTLSFLIDQITDGAFNYLGTDFPYDTWGHAPTPLFLEDFTPTDNSVTTLKKYLIETIALLQSNPELTEYEISQLYSRLVTKDNTVFTVMTIDSVGSNIKHQRFIVKKKTVNPDDLKVLREMVIASYENMLSWIIRLLDTRKALSYDQKILQMISDMNIDEVSDVDRIYRQLEALNDYISVKIRTSLNREEYNAYANIRKILMTTQVVNETFTKKNGTIATSYEDLLKDVNYTLYQRLTSDTIDLPTEEEYAIQTLMKLCDELTLLESVNTNNIQRVVEYLFKIINFLKSAKVDMVDFQIIYLMTDRGMNHFKLLSEIYRQYVICEPNKKEKFLLEAFLSITFVVQDLLDTLHLKDDGKRMRVTAQLESEFQKLTDLMVTDATHTTIDAFSYLMDWVSSELIEIEQAEVMTMQEMQSSEMTQSLKSANLSMRSMLCTVGSAVQLASNLLMDQKDGNRLDVQMSMSDHLRLVHDQINRAVVGSTNVHDGMMMQSRLIKVSETIIK